MVVGIGMMAGLALRRVGMVMAARRAARAAEPRMVRFGCWMARGALVRMRMMRMRRRGSWYRCQLAWLAVWAAVKAARVVAKIQVSRRVMREAQMMQARAPAGAPRRMMGERSAMVGSLLMMFH